MIIINIFYKDFTEELSLLRLKIFNYLSKKDKNNVCKKDFELYTSETRINFISPERKDYTIRKHYNYEIINFDVLPNEKDIFSILDRIYDKKEYYVLEKASLTDAYLSKDIINSIIHVKNLNDFEVKQFDEYYWGVFKSKEELNKYLEKHVNMLIEDCNIKIRLLEKFKKDYLLESEV